MNTYSMQFWYYTDLRTDETVQARNEPTALAKALENLGLDEWTEEREGFEIRIKRVSKQAATSPTTV